MASLKGVFITKQVTWRDFANGGRMPAITLVAVRALDKDGRIAQTLGKHLSANIIEADTFADVATGLLHYRIPVHVRKESEAEANRVTRIRESINCDGRL